MNPVKSNGLRRRSPTLLRTLAAERGFSRPGPGEDGPTVPPAGPDYDTDCEPDTLRPGDH